MSKWDDGGWNSGDDEWGTNAVPGNKPTEMSSSFQKLSVNDVSRYQDQQENRSSSKSSKVPDRISFGRKRHNERYDYERSSNWERKDRQNDQRQNNSRNNDYHENRRDFRHRGSRNDYDQRCQRNNDYFDNRNEFQEKDSRNDYYDKKNQRRNDYCPRNQKDNFNEFSDGYKQGDQQRRFHDESQESCEITIHSRDCGRIIGKGGSKIRELQEDSKARIKVCKNDGEDERVPVIITGSTGAIDKAKSLIQELIDEADMYRRPLPTSHADDSDSQSAKEKFKQNGMINWGLVIADAEEQRAAYWSKFPSIIKDFYIEDDDVADMTKREVDKWRVENFNLSVVDLSSEHRIPLNPVLTFEQAFSHYPEILTQIYKQKFVKPSPIQSQVWPLALRGYDVIGIAQTGTGKTLAFLLPAFIHIDNQTVPRSERKGPSALVLTPTRELALQIEMEINKYSYKGVRCVCVYGGGDRKKQVKSVMSGVEIIVATPGRFNDLLECQIISLESITYLVLDEADRMLDMGFEPQIMKILIDIRPDRQTLMTSATWPSGVRRLAQSYLTNPFQVTVGSLDLAATHTVQQVIEIVEEEDKRERLYEFIANMEKDDKVLVFVGKKSVCDDVASDLALRNIICQSIHGGREQYDREQALDDFKTGLVKILVATDVASRGLDVKDITHVFNYDFPRNTEEYVHRVGRTGRAGRSGVSLSLVTRSDWGSAKELIAILEEAEQEVPLELYAMAERFEKMKERRAMERSSYSGGGGRRGGGRGGGRGFRRGGNRSGW